MNTVAEGIDVWDAACRDVAREVLDGCGIDAPPVDAREVAERLSIGVAYDTLQCGRGRLKRFGERTAILLRPDERPEREQWTVAHEIGEACAHRVFELAGLDPAETDERQREHIANRMASCLLLPADWFLQDARLLDGDVRLLKREYRTASHELILMNLLTLPDLTLATVFDQGRMTRRRGNGQLRPPPLLPVERRVWRRIHETGRRHAETHDGVRVQGWAVHEPGWKRELLRTTVTEGIDAAPELNDDWVAGCDVRGACEVS